MSILLLLIVGAWFGYREIGVSFLGIHIRDLVSTRVFGGIMILVAATLFVLVVLAVNESPSSVNNLNITDAYIIMCAIVMSVAIVRSANQYTSAVTAFWGALAALSYHENWTFYPSMTACLLSLLVAPVLGVLFFFLYDRLFDRIILKTDRHLLLKNLFMR